MILDATPDSEVVAEAADGIEAVELGLREDIELTVLDVAIPRRTGLAAARELSPRRPATGGECCRCTTSTSASSSASVKLVAGAHAIRHGLVEP